MDKTVLRNQIFSYETPSRDLVVAYVKLLCDEAKRLSIGERSRGDYRNPAHKFPQARGEDIASDISSVLAQQGWIDWESEPELEAIGSIAGNLEINTDNQNLWQELFEKADRL